MIWRLWLSRAWWEKFKIWEQCTGQPSAKKLIYFSLQTQRMCITRNTSSSSFFLKGWAPVLIKPIKTGLFVDFDKAKTLTVSQTLLSQSHDCFVWSSAASRQHTLSFLFLLLFLLGFLWWLAVVILHQQRGVGAVFFVSLIFSLFSWAVTVVRPFSPLVTAQNWTPQPPDSYPHPIPAPPKPDISHQFVGHGSPQLSHGDLCQIWLPSFFPPFVLKHAFQNLRENPHSVPPPPR